MVRIPLVSAREIIKALRKIGYEPVRQHGSHIRLCGSGLRSITIPNHKLIGHGLMHKILRDAEISPEEFIKLFF